MSDMSDVYLLPLSKHGTQVSEVGSIASKELIYCAETFLTDCGGRMEWKGIPQSMNTWNKRVTMLSLMRYGISKMHSCL